MSGFASTTTTIAFTDLNPGDKLAMSVDYHYGAGGKLELDEGFSSQIVQEDGSIAFAEVTRFLTQGHAGTAKAWLRPNGSDRDADPVDYATGPDAGQPVVITFHLP